MKWILILVALAAAGGAAWWVKNAPPAKPLAALQVNGQEGGALAAGQPGELSFRFSWKGNTPISAFDLEHEKLMHLVVVSADYASYAHVHPALDPATGWFKLKVNQPVSDPDNQDAPRAFPSPGRYHLFTEVKPTGHPFIVMDTFDVAATGAPAPPASLAPDPVSPAGEISKKIDGYDVKLRVSRGGLDKLRFVTLAYHVEQGGKPVKDLVNWLSMPGHAILLSAQGASAADKSFRHLHAAMGDPGPGAMHCPPPDAKYGPDLEFYLRGDEIPPPGVYKLWGQFKHAGRVLTFPFVIQL